MNKIYPVYVNDRDNPLPILREEEETVCRKLSHQEAFFTILAMFNATTECSGNYYPAKT